MNDHNEELQPPIVRPNPLNFGTFQQGGSLTRQEWISNPNEQQLLWCADNRGTSWLTLEPSAGTLEADKQEPINVTANTSSLAVGDHAATLTFTCSGHTSHILRITSCSGSKLFPIPEEQYDFTASDHQSV